MEMGLTDSGHEAPRVYQNKTKAMYDSSHTPPRSPTGIHYQNTYSVSEYRQPGQSSDDS